MVVAEVDLAFVAGEFDITFVGDITVPLMKDVLAQAPTAVCSLVPTNVPQPTNWIYGSYHLALAMSINLSDRLRNAGSMQRLELEDPHG